MIPITINPFSVTRGLFVLAPHFNCTVVNVHIISHMGLDEGFDHQGRPWLALLLSEGS